MLVEVLMLLLLSLLQHESELQVYYLPVTGQSWHMA
jgi:hypothetical protein